jgi:hypothetical protein
MKVLKIVVKRLILTISLSVSSSLLFSQGSMGVTGLLNSPNAIFSPDATVKIGGNFLHKMLTPDTWDYNTFNYFLNVTFFPFVEIAITNTAFDLYNEGKFTNVDRAVCVRFKLLNEGKYYPAVAVGSNDVITSNRENIFSSGSGNKYFGTHYFAISKHIYVLGSKIGLHSAYNILSGKRQKINYPISGGLSFSPSFLRSMNLIAEYDTRNYNLGATITLFKHLYLQFFFQDMKYLSFGGYLFFTIQ